MAFAALSSLKHTIRGLLSSSSSTLSLESALDQATSLEHALQRCSGCVTEMDDRIIMEESRRLEDAIEFSLSADQDVECFARTAKNMEANIVESWEHTAAKMIEESIMKLCLCVPRTEKNSSPDEEDEEEGYSSSSMVGLSDLFLRMKDHLLNPTNSFNVFEDCENVTWISGMAGIGKTRLAKKLFHDPSIKASFECRAFITMGGDCVAFEKEKKIMEGDYEVLDGSFWRLFCGKKTLFVFDDFREDGYFFDYNGEATKDKRNQILLTSRLSLGFYSKSTLQMRFLNEEESWKLLRREVFGEEDEEEDCPEELVKAGKKIAEECEGLPLLIIAVAPILLSKAQKNPEAWKRVAEKPDSVLKEASHQISDQLLSNYHHLSEELKLCFLYIAAFPKKYVVWATSIAYLWYAEGFIDGYPNYSLSRFVQNSLAIECEKGDFWCVDLNCKACRLHCAYWYVCRREAENKKLLYTMNSLDDGLDERIEGHRRLAIYTNVLFAIKEVHDSIASISTVRSLLCTGPYHPYQVPMCWEWKLLRVLSALTIRFYEFPVEVVKLIYLKYLSLTCNANLPPSISKLWKLQFLIVHQHSSIKRVGVVSYLPVEIWDLQELEVLQIMGRNLPDPPHQGVVSPKLRKLLDVGAESCTEGVLKSLPRLKKIRVQIELAPHAAETTMSCFDHLSCLDGLRSFQSVVMNPIMSRLPPPLSFYMDHLQSLSLSGFGYPWRDINNIAPLPNLQRLKLKCYAFRGEKWETEEGMSFKRLDYLCIDDTDLMEWTAGDDTFPRLSCLNMKNCHKLQEIPAFSMRNYLKIQLVDCNPLAETRTQQRNTTCREGFTVSFSASYSWKEEKVKS